MNVAPDLIVIRHAQVDPQWRSICYGAMDVPLSRDGEEASQQLADRIAGRLSPVAIYHSDLHRTRMLAERLRDALDDDTALIADHRLRERDYGTWQGLSWDQAYASDPENFIDLIEAPDTYRPHGGETTIQMQQRVIAWFHEFQTSQKSVQPAADRPRTAIAISHSGPIAALAGYLLELHPRDWQPWTIGNLESLCIDGPNVSRRQW